MSRIKPILLMLAVLGLVFSVGAQTQKPAVTVIDGALNPYQIPDTTAYRLYFFVLTNEAQGANLGMLNLSPADKEAAIRILNDFRIEDARIRETHNSLAASGKANPVAFQQERDTLIDDTRTKLRETLSVEGMFVLDSAIQLNKSKVRITQTTTAPLTIKAAAQTAGPPPIQLRPCYPSSVTWTASAATTQTQSVTYSSPNYTITQSAVSDGSAVPEYTYPPSCLPEAVTELYIPEVNNVLGTEGGWTAGAAVNGGTEFNVGTAINIVINQSTIDGGLSNILTSSYGDWIEGSPQDYEEDDVILPQWQVDLQWEWAYTRAASTGSTSNCKPASDGTLLCDAAVINWCTAVTTPPDLNMTVVHLTTKPPYPYYENVAGCTRIGGTGATWVCSPAVSLPNPTKAPLASCTSYDKSHIIAK